jgi:hypothetical protein
MSSGNVCEASSTPPLVNGGLAFHASKKQSMMQHDSPKDAPASAVPSAETSVDSTDQSLRIFICYPRNMIREVDEFERTLRICLGNLKTTYKVFRDVSASQEESIRIGEKWKEAINRELDSCVCCVVVLVPAIFERTECAYEIEYFQRRVEGGENCFFFPIEFLSVRSEFKRRLEQGHVIARILHARQLYDFTEGWSETEEKRYKKTVSEIATRIDNRVQAIGRAVDPQRATPAPGGLQPRLTPLVRGRMRLPILAPLGIALIAGIMTFGQWVSARWPFGGAVTHDLAGAPRQAPASVPESVPASWAPLPAGSYLTPRAKAVATFRAADRSAVVSVTIASGTVRPEPGTNEVLERSKIKGENWLRYRLADRTFANVPEEDVVLHLPSDR